jgi:hypothetical protein
MGILTARQTIEDFMHHAISTDLGRSSPSVHSCHSWPGILECFGNDGRMIREYQGVIMRLEGVRLNMSGYV